MIPILFSNVLRFIFLVLLQVLLLNNIALYHLANPYLYVLFIIMMPVDIPIFWLYAFSFTLGISIDLFCNTVGIHAAACVLTAYIRILILTRRTMTGNGLEFDLVPNLASMGFNRFVAYCSVLILVHHFILVSLDIFRASEIFYILIRTIASGIFTLVLILLTQYIFSGRRARQ